MYEKMQEFALTEITPRPCTSAVWGQCPVLFHPESPQSVWSGGLQWFNHGFRYLAKVVAYTVHQYIWFCWISCHAVKLHLQRVPIYPNTKSHQEKRSHWQPVSLRGILNWLIKNNKKNDTMTTFTQLKEFRFSFPVLGGCKDLESSGK